MKQKHNKEKKDAGLFVSQHSSKPNVVCSQSPATQTESSKDVKIDVTEGRVWVQIGNVGVGFDKANFISLIEQSESYQFALGLKQGLGG